MGVSRQYMAKTNMKRLFRLVLPLYRRVRELVLGWMPWSITFVTYRCMRRVPRLYFAIRAVIMGELSRTTK
jgi:hypothetical protein